MEVRAAPPAEILGGNADIPGVPALAGKDSGANVSVCGVAPGGAPKRGAPDRCGIVGVPFARGVKTGFAEGEGLGGAETGGARTLSQLMLRSALLATLLGLASDAPRFGRAGTVSCSS